jgi:hypothetical protein
MSDRIRHTRDLLRKHIASHEMPRAFVGMDGFVDEIVRVVDQRADAWTYQPIRTISDYAARLATAAGKSTNVEFVLEVVKMGGNAPLLADALGRLGIRVRTVGALGNPMLHDAFTPLREYGPVVGLTPPAVTIATEFDDGKIMHGRLEPLTDITTKTMVTGMGGEDAVVEALREARLVALVNWTMIPRLTEVIAGIRERLATVRDGVARMAFFDLCDPAKRPRADLREVLLLMGRYVDAGVHPILGLNEKESSECCAALDIEEGESGVEGLIARAQRLRDATGIPEVVIHPRTFAVVVSPEGQAHIAGPVCEKPRLTTGAGDSFNGGYCFARLMGMAPGDAIVCGKGVSGFYVRNARGPSCEELLSFFDAWAEKRLD